MMSPDHTGVILNDLSASNTTMMILTILIVALIILSVSYVACLVLAMSKPTHDVTLHIVRDSILSSRHGCYGYADGRGHHANGGHIINE